MTPRNSIAWFKATWQTEIAAAIAGTPFCENMLAAIAWQETGYLWSPLIGAHDAAEILKLCAGDTIDAPRRSAFPKNRADLESRTDGPRMFREAREALERVVRMTGTYRAAARNPDKFCHGFGIFQYDLQFFLEDADFFLEKRWHDFAECLSRFVTELRRAMTRVYGAGKTTLTDEEKVYVAIAYNRGRADPGKGFKQGHRNDEGEYYGENVWEYFQLAKSLTSIPGGALRPPSFMSCSVQFSFPEDVKAKILVVKILTSGNNRTSPASSYVKSPSFTSPFATTKGLLGQSQNREFSAALEESKPVAPPGAAWPRLFEEALRGACDWGVDQVRALCCRGPVTGPAASSGVFVRYKTHSFPSLNSLP